MLSQTLQQFHQNPQETLAAAQHKPEVRKFLQEFCSVMGDHFTALADKEEGGRARRQTASQITEVPDPGESKNVNVTTPAFLNETLIC